MEFLIVFLPLLGAIIAGFFGQRIGDRGAQLVTCGLLVLAAVLASISFVGTAFGDEKVKLIELFTWVDSGAFEASWALRIDTLSSVMLLVVTVVSAMVHIYSIGYMSHDKSIPRFFSYLSLFTFFMLMLVTADNFVQMFFGWEGVGLASYLLIGFWYHKPSANAAAIKAFLVNRVGDIGFALGIGGAFLLFGTVNFEQAFQVAPQYADAQMSFLGYEGHALTIVSLLLFVGAMGKSAQLGLHTWLPDAMEGPTPVSALIHAATMVTAGVFMLVRLSPILEYAPDALTVVTIVGAATAFFAATVGTTQNDIKRVIAYSTCSQLGYMFFAIGVSAYSAAIFHLVTHAFFKALLFLGAGSVIHAVSDEQDMRKMGGLWKTIPYTYVLMWIGSLALAGIPPFAGFFSKDMILEAAYAAGNNASQFAFWAGVIAAFLTAFYSWRVLLMTFHGKFRGEAEVFAHAHESPKVMILPLVVLAIGALLSGYVAYDWFVGEGREAFWAESILTLGDAIEAGHNVPGWVKLLPLVVAVSGIATAYLAYSLLPGLPARFTAAARPLYLFLLNKWYFDELFDFLFVRPARALGRSFWQTGDIMLIDGFGPDGVASTARNIAQRVARVQSGYVYHYAFAMLIGVVFLVSWYLLTRIG